MKSDYDRVTDIGKWKNKILIASTAVTLLLTVNEKYEISTKYLQLADYIQLAIGVNSILIVLYVFLDFRENYIFTKAERNRRLQYIDNSFDTNFAGKKIEDYFSQDKLNPGFYKLSVNCFENVFHTFNVAKKMQTSIYLKAFAVVVIFIFSAVVGEKGAVRTLIEAILPLALIQNALRLSIFVSRLDNLFESFASFFTSVKGSVFLNREPGALKNVINRLVSY